MPREIYFLSLKSAVTTECYSKTQLAIRHCCKKNIYLIRNQKFVRVDYQGAFRLLGFIPLAFSLPGQFLTGASLNATMFWMCHIGNLLLAIGRFWKKHCDYSCCIWAGPGLEVWFVICADLGNAAEREFDYPIYGLFFNSRTRGGFPWNVACEESVGGGRALLFIWYFVSNCCHLANAVSMT